MTMNEQPQPMQLTEDQQARIAATLKRIRAGLAGADGRVAPEPAHVFRPGTQGAEGP